MASDQSVVAILSVVLAGVAKVVAIAAAVLLYKYFSVLLGFGATVLQPLKPVTLPAVF